MSLHYLGKHEPTEIVSFQSCCMPCLENDTAAGASEVPGTCCRLRLLLGRKSVHCSVASQLAERSRLRAEQCEEARHRCWTPAALSPNVLLVADGVRCCFKTGLHWAILRQAGGESGRQILRWWVSKIQQAKAVWFSRQTERHNFRGSFSPGSADIS